MANNRQRHDAITTGNICLVGLMGSGKSTVGPLLAEKLDFTSVDLDANISSSLKRSIREIFEEQGEERFRAEESRQLRLACANGKRVIACGGGVVLSPENRGFLRRQTTVYLKVSPEVLAQRVGAAKDRPLLAGAASPVQRLATLLKEREPLYLDCARITVLAEGKGPHVIVDDLLTRLPAHESPETP